ncbi:hypothetical protein RHCRD62_60134 [Rhodococcus sp. RD6.2]|nr:hypothetical protein RHCRD62_60134 [Rhodococcus sp. RD6.2]
MSRSRIRRRVEYLGAVLGLVDIDARPTGSGPFRATPMNTSPSEARHFAGLGTSTWENNRGGQLL